MTRWQRLGTRILLHGELFAEAVDEIAAMQIFNALVALDPKPRDTRPNRRVLINLNACRVRQEGDEMACACGLRWAVDDTDPPLCVHRAPR